MQEEAVSKKDQRGRTLSRLLSVAKTEFAEKGYGETSTNEVVEKAEVTRGALYYHFKDKEDLFRGVVEQVAREVLAAVMDDAESETSPWPGLVAGCHAFLDVCSDPAVRQILLIDAPAVLGWQEWRQIDTRYSMGSLKEGLQACADAGDIQPSSIDALTHLISGALNEGALMIAEAEDGNAAREAIKMEVENLLVGLRRLAVT